MGFTGIPSAMASFGSPGYADYMVDAMGNTWTRNLGIDGYCEDVNANYGCMLQTQGRGSMPSWRQIVARVRALQPQVVMSGEGYSSWDDVARSDADLGGQGYGGYHQAMKQAVFSGDASNLEHVASTSGADGATLVCYLHRAYDGKQPGGCPTLYFRDVSTRVPTQGLREPMRSAVGAALPNVLAHHWRETTAPCCPLRSGRRQQPSGT